MKTRHSIQGQAPAAGKLVEAYTCMPATLPRDLQKAAAQKAIEENPENKLDRRGGGHELPLGAVDEKGVITTGRKWRNGHTLRVKFLDGNEAVQRKVAKYIKQWSDCANIGFEFVQAGAPAEIQVSFEQKGRSWSLLGTDALAVPQGQPTMNYGWLDPDSNDETYSAVVLHETGHALGLIHEHMHPKGNIRWNKLYVLQDCQSRMGWTQEMVQSNIFDVYDLPDAEFTPIDRDSIMMYPIPPGWTTNGYVVGWNTQLSTDDRKFIARQYPK
jgi:serralysin